jgi:hypothetical protein
VVIEVFAKDEKMKQHQQIPHDSVLGLSHEFVALFPCHDSKVQALCSANLGEDGLGEFALGCPACGFGSG